ncbi:ABC transporter transmembrane region domain-containing protein [Sarocladium implicatum]|nr:ABC transporter transmembrane region domain-containing protein [Sarocladium implicatum]
MSASAANQLPQGEEPAISQTTSPPTNEKDVAGDATVHVKSEEDKKAARPERTATFRDYLRVFTYASKWDFFAYGAGTIASIGAGTTLPLMNIIFGAFVKEFSDFANLQSMATGDFTKTVDKLALYLFALFLGRWFLNYINKFAFRMIGIRLSSAVRLHYLQRLLGQSVHVLDSMPPGYATVTITSTANILQLGISEKLGIFVEFLSTIITALIVAFTYSWRLTLVTASLVLFIAFVIGAILPAILKFHARQKRAESKATSIASEALASYRMVTACGAESRVSSKYVTFVEEAKRHTHVLAPLIAFMTGCIFFGVFGAFGLAFWFGIRLYTEGNLDNVGTITVVLFSVMMIVFSLERISTPLLAVGKAMVAACEFFIVIDAPQPPKGHLKEPDVTATDDIVFDKVTFAYPSRPHVKILDELDLRIEAGKITAIVGPSGSGKSTIVGLIQRWYTLQEQYLMEKVIDPEKKKKEEQKMKKRAKRQKKGQEVEDSESEAEEATEGVIPDTGEDGEPVQLSGNISSSGHPLQDMELRWWRSQIGLVQQEPFLFNETIYSNVAKGLIGSQWENESEEVKRGLVKDACVEAFADEFQYDTIVGDSGAKLSGGQRQRIAIARSIVRKPKILILDEATSAIDVRGERIVQAALDRVAKNRTTITIAHRLSTIKKADRIVVIKKGKVAESGTHEGLIAKEGGVYHALVNAQALSLGEPTDAQEEDVKFDEDGDELSREKSKAKSEREEEDDGTGGKMKERNILQSFGLFFWETKSTWWLKGLTVLFAMSAGAAIPMQAYLFAHSIDAFKYQTMPDKLRDEGHFWGLMFMVLAISTGISYFSCFFFSNRLAAAVRAKYQAQYFDAILYQKTSFFDDEDHSHGTMTSRAAGDPQQLEELMGANMASVYIAIFTLLGGIIISFSYAWKLAIVSSCVVLPVLLFTSFWRFKYEIQFEKMNNDVFAESSKFASESIGAFRTVSAFTLEDTITNRFENLCRGHVRDAFKKARWVSLLFGFADSTNMACQALLFYYGGRLLAKGEYDVIAFFVTLIASMNSAESAGQSLSFGPNAAQATAAANRIIRMRESRLPAAHEEQDGIPDGEGGAKIELRNLKFRYPTREAPVFNGLSFTIEKGQFAALVGASGCGKTSIISLLERFYDLDGGQILCNGKDIAEMNVYAYRKHLSLVAQEATLFKGTIRENILLGVDTSTTTDDQLHQACRDASIHDFIISLPEGYNTNIGSRGVSLSGGQKQRLAIARALIRNPDVLLLDEATSSLDSESEKLVQAAFERAGKGRTMVVVAHRLATVQNADVIFVLGEGGVLLEKGSHVELLKKRGAYWSMCQSQALDR